ncbi:MAG: LysR family transcriptional regulator [Acidobacteriota bacterium]|nr:LysR family transcriptional regulator [Blastocatellia bacterium]MDW8412066.1 LysR family transcriptional regulator [Acidobacteriota bacterium]
MEMSQLEMFLAVIEEKSFSRAGQRVFRTQAAVSQAIRKLETELGEVLFDRTTKDGRLTDAGQVLEGYARKILDLRSEARKALQDLRSLQRGKLQIGANEYTVMYLLPLVAQFKQHCPHIMVEVKRCKASQIPNELLSYSIDIGAITFKPKQSELQSVHVASDPLVLVVAPTHPLATRSSVSVCELGSEVFVAHDVVSPYRRKVIETFEQYNTPLNIVLELPSIEAIKRFVEMQQGIGILPRLAVEVEVARGQLVAIPIREIALERKIRLVYRKKATLSHTAKAFLQICKVATSPLDVAATLSADR